MNTVSANELITAGHNFRFVANDGDAVYDDCDCRKECKCPRDGVTGAKGFRSGGEIDGFADIGRETTFDAEWELHCARVALENVETGVVDADAEETDDLETAVERLTWADGGWSEGSADTSEMNVGYWDEVANSHLAEMKHAFDGMWVRRQDVRDCGKPVKGAMQASKDDRTARFDRLRRDAKRSRARGDIARLEALKLGVKERYDASVRLVKARGKNEWHLLYLTSAQVGYLLRV